MSTSTPYFEIEATDSDSGFYSNSSGHCTSVDSSLPPEKFKLFPCQTPETFDSLLDNGSALSSLEYRKKKPENTFCTSPQCIRTICREKIYIDFLLLLGEKNNYTPIVKKILDYLSDEDLYSAANVSKSWKKIILLIPTQRRKYRNYVRKLESAKENLRMVTSSNTCEDRIVVKRKNTLTEIQNINKPLTNSNSPRSSTSPVARSSRFEAYQTEAQRLKIGRRLFVCPKCKLPAHVDEKEFQTAVCTNSECYYRFCILCHCLAHPSRMCNFISTPVVHKQTNLMGTRKSKKNLKRLLL